MEIKDTSNVAAQKFFYALAGELANALHVRIGFVSELQKTFSTRVRLLALWDTGTFADTFDYDIKRTPCEHVFARGLAYYPGGVQDIFPHDRWLREKGIESYLAAATYDSKGNPIGHVGVMDDRPMRGSIPEKSIVRILANLAGVEIEAKEP